MSSNLTLPLPVGAAVPISEITLWRQGMQQVVVLAGGQAVAIWHTATADGNFYEIYARRLDAAGQPLGPEFLVNTTRALDQFLPDVAALADGGFVVIWHSVEYADEVAWNGNPFLFTLFSQRFAADGTPVGSEQTIIKDMYYDPYGVDVVALAGGGYVAIWERHGNAAWDTAPEGYFRVFDADGHPVGPPVRPDPFFAGPELGAQVIALAGGGFAIMKFHLDDLQNGNLDFEVRVYSAAGVQQGTAFEVSNVAQEESDMELVALAGGGFLAAWMAHPPNEFSHVFVRVFGADGAPVGGNIRIDAPPADRSVFVQAMALADGGFVVSWTEGAPATPDSQIMAQVFSATGLALSDPKLIASFEQTFGGYADTHSLHELPGGEILITWQSLEGGLHGRLMEPDGRLHPGSVTLVPAYYVASNFEVTPLPDGRIAIAFESSFGGSYYDMQDVQVLTVELNPSGGLQGGYGEGADTRQLLGASAVVHALGGDDVVFTGVNGDTVYGDRGQDYLVGGSADDLLVGGSGNDTLAGGYAKEPDRSIDDRLFGGLGDDLLIAVQGEDRLFGGAGNDIFARCGFGHGTQVYGGTGDDLIRAWAARVYGGAGNDAIILGPYAEIIEGGEGTDTLIFEYERDRNIDTEDSIHIVSIDLNATTVETHFITRFAGFENVLVIGLLELGIISGNALDNCIQTDGSPSYHTGDFLQGREGNDTLIAGAGKDTLDGGVGADWLDGGTELDLASYAGALAGVRVDLVNPTDREGEAVGDELFSIEGLRGSAHNDFLAGSNLDNRLEGGDGDDALLGRSGNDTLNGGAGNDTLSGSADKNALTGRSGTDVTRGSVDADVFLFNTALNSATNVDTITWFSSSDSIQLEADIFTALEGSLTFDEFRIVKAGTGFAAVDGTDHILYVKSTGQLFYDADANGSTNRVLFAKLPDGTALEFGNLLLV